MSAAPPKELHFWAFLQGIGHYPGGWRYRGAKPRSVFDAAYYQQVGRLVERGRFDAVVFGDQLQARGAEGRTPALLAAPTLDPLTLLAAIGDVARPSWRAAPSCRVGSSASDDDRMNLG